MPTAELFHISRETNYFLLTIHFRAEFGLCDEGIHIIYGKTVGCYDVIPNFERKE